ncbi:MAG: hypothetical protein R2710_13760 [Acidimicrobiales bacterium]
MTVPRSAVRCRWRPTALSLVLAALMVGCGPSDPQPRAEPTSSTTSAPSSTTTASLAPTSTPDDVLCGTELPVFPTTSITGDTVVDTEGLDGPADGADPALENQLVRHWDGDAGTTIEIRWPAGPGPDTESSVELTQLIDTASPSPCDVVRVSGYGQQDRLNDIFGVFVDSLDGSDAKPAFIQQQQELVTPAVADEPGDCDEPVITSLDADGLPEADAVVTLLGRYANDRTNGHGYESCFTVAGLRELEIQLERDGAPDIVRPAESFGFEAEALATYLDADPLRIVRETLRVTTIPVDGGVRLLFSALTTGPDSNVGEEEAIAFIDEFLILLGDGDYDSAAGYLVNEGVSDAVLEAMPTFEDEPGEALRRYCRDAYCDVTYKINESIDFDAVSRDIDVTFFGDDDTVEAVMVVGAFEGQLVLLTPPPARS